MSLISSLQYNRARWYDPATGRFISQDPLGLLPDSNPYRYGHNSPENADASGLWFGLDDLFASGAGALVGVLGQGISDVVSGNFSGWERYVGAALGGAAAGFVFANTFSFTLAGAVGGAVDNASTQLLKLATGKQDSFDYASLGVSVVAGTLGGAAGGALLGQLGGAAAQATFRAFVGSGAAGGVVTGAIGGFYNGSLGAAEQGGNVFWGGLAGAGRGALAGGVVGALAGAAGYKIAKGAQNVTETPRQRLLFPEMEDPVAPAPTMGARNPLALPEGYIGPERQLPYRGPILGGSYRDVRAANVGGDIHLMPADSVSPLSRELGPAIHMPTPEHAQTASFGGSRAARAYRQQQQQLIQQGRFMDAVQMDINDLRNLFGNRYDEHIRQMLEWIRQSRTVPGQ